MQLSKIKFTDIIKKAKKLISLENSVFLFFSLVLMVFIFALEKVQMGHPIHLLAFLKENHLEFLTYFFFFMLIASVFYFSDSWKFSSIVKRTFFLLLPSEIITLYMLCNMIRVNLWLTLFSAIYAVSFSVYLISFWHAINKTDFSDENLRSWTKKQSWINISFIAFVIVLNLLFGLHNIGKFAAVDEALWTSDRIPNFWKDLGEANWNGTRVSDKPGLTVVLVSGIGILSEDPIKFKNLHWEYTNPNDTETMNSALRIPIYVLMAIFLPFFYFFIEKTAGRNSALFSTIFIGLSPPLIGMARIINPDSILWIFTGISILSYFAYLKKEKLSFLYLSGFFLGIALLTKYVANIIYVYFFALLFFEYITSKAHYEKLEIRKYFKKKLSELGILTFISILTFYALYPAVWAKPQRILIATVESQAFSSTWPFFAVILVLILSDIFILKAKFLSLLVNFLEKNKKIICWIFVLFFLVGIAFVFINTYSGMRFFDFEAILASPKSSYQSAGLWGLIFANFYPLVFGISPLALVLIIMASFKLFKKNNESDKFIFYLIFFVIFYYIGSSVNKVASPVRYQIMLFPLILTIAGISAGNIIEKLKLKVKELYLIFLSLVLLGGWVLYSNYPFYLSYASKLLPNQYYLDVKDMGAGSFEAANFLNSLPDPEKITIWTDKSGVCNFFPGRCSSSLSSPDLKNIKFDYAIISSGRESRTTRMISSKLDSPLNYDLHLNDLYDGKIPPVFEVKINGREGQYVKIFKINY